MIECPHCGKMLSQSEDWVPHSKECRGQRQDGTAELVTDDMIRREGLALSYEARNRAHIAEIVRREARYKPPEEMIAR